MKAQAIQTFLDKLLVGIAAAVERDWQNIKSFTQLPETVWKPDEAHDEFTARVNILIRAALAKVRIPQPGRGVYVIDDVDWGRI